MKYRLLITGCSTGLGLALAEKFEAEGHSVLKHNGKQCYDLRLTYEVEKLAEEALNFGANVLINNAAIVCPNLEFFDYDVARINSMIDVNLKAPILLSFLLRNSLSRIININSMVGLEHKKPRTLYSATKWGLRGFSESLKLENKIKILDVYPTNIKTFPNRENAMELNFVIDKIYNAFINNDSKLILDGRNL